MEAVERQQPRISVNKLGEYVTAAPARRRRIIMDQKRPKNFIVPRYAAAEEKIVGLLTGALREDDLLQAIEDLETDSGGTEWQEQTNQLCAEAIGSFLDSLDVLDVDGVEFRAPTQSATPLKIGGTSVSVRPEVSIERLGRRGSKSRGLLKIHLGKTTQLDGNSANAITTCLRKYAEETMPPTQVDHRLCWVLDVFSGGLFEAPRSHKSRMKDIDAACEEIARAWPAL